MKKLMLAAAIVCAAVASQAATCSWTVSTSGTLANPAGVTLVTSITTPQMYVFMTTATVANERKALLAALKTAADAGNAATALSGAWKTVNLADGSFSATEFTSEGDVGISTSFYGVILGADAAGNQYAYFTSSATDNSIDRTDGTTAIVLDGSATTLKDLDTTTCKSAQWYQISEAVPEPTSGLLLLLGVGALALRRRRA